MAAKGLTDKQERFCQEYITDLNGTQAAIRAGYSENTANEIAAQNLAKLSVQDRVQELKAKRAQRTQVTQDRVLLEMARLAFNDPRRVFSENGALLPVQDWPDDVAAAISSIKVTEEYDGQGEDRKFIGWTKEVKFWDKGKQIELLARHLGMFMEDRKNPKNALEELIKEASPDDLMGLLHGIKDRLSIVHEQPAT